MALTPYSVSPFLRDHTVGPKPTMYWVTFTPNFLAGTMWPISCSAMEASRPRANTRTPTVYSNQAGIAGRLLSSPLVGTGGQLPGARPGPGVRLFNVLDGTRV